MRIGRSPVTWVTIRSGCPDVSSLAFVKESQGVVMDTATNSATNCRRTATVVSAWIVGLAVWASGMAGLAMFF